MLAIPPTVSPGGLSRYARLNPGYTRQGGAAWRWMASGAGIEDLPLEQLRGFDIGRPQPG